MKPDFSPSMLAAFLRARAAHAHFCHPARCGMVATVRREKAGWRKAARVTVAEIDMAWMGRLLRPEPRARIWGALGHVPADHGIMLIHGGQEVVGHG